MATIQGVYVALFGRPADPTGLNYFTDVTDNGADLTKIGDLASTAEYQARFEGMSNAQIITSIYQSLFDRNPEQAGLDFFVKAMADGTFSINNIAIAILDGAQGDDKTLVDKKVAAADMFTEALDTPDEVAAYYGAEAAAKGILFLDAVTADSADVDEATVDAVVAELPAVSSGQTFTLTTDADTATASVFEAPLQTLSGTEAATTLNSSDNLTGSGENPTLNATITDAQGILAPTLNGIKNLNISAQEKVAGGATPEISLRNSDGVKTITNNSSSSVLTVSDVKVVEGFLASVMKTSSNTNVAFDDASLTGDTVVGVKLNSSGGTVNLNNTSSGDIETVNLETLGGPTSFVTSTTGIRTSEDETINKGGISVEGLTTLNISGSGALALGQVGDKDLTTIDATAATADVKMELADGANDADVTYTGSATNRDILSMQNGLTKDDTIDGGAGEGDILQLTSDSDKFVSSSAAGDISVKGFETLQLRANADDAFDLDVLGSGHGVKTIQIVTVEDNNADLELKNLTSGVDVTIANEDGAIENFDDINIHFKEDDEKSSFTLNIVSDDQSEALDIDDLSIGVGDSHNDNDLETVKIVVNTEDSDANKNVTIDDLVTDSVEELEVEGSANLTITNTITSAALDTVSAKDFEGDLVIDLSNATDAAKVETGSGDDNITTGAQADMIKTGDGKDIVKAGDGIDSVDLGDGKDILNLDGILATENRDIVSGFTAGSDGDVVQIDATDTAAATASTSSPAFQVVTATDGTDTTLEDVDIIEFAMDLTGSNIASGAGLLTALGFDNTDTAAGDDDLSLDTDTDTAYIIAYADGKGYLYHAADSNADAGELGGSEISLVGVFNDVAVGALTADNFDLV